MENRVEAGTSDRRGIALIALVVILVITAAWWALALWPAGTAQPEWLARTRAACFGSARGGLPNAGGWILLIGEPIGMLGILLAVWRRALWRDLRLVFGHPTWRYAAIGVSATAVLFTVATGVRVGREWARLSAEPFDVNVTVRAADIAVPTIALTDQSGRLTSLADFGGETVLLAFAFAHCTTVCPTIVNELHAVRTQADRPELPIVIVTVDPWRDTPERLATIADAWRLSPHDFVLSGGVDEVNAVLDQLGVGRWRNETTGDVTHATTAMLINDRGRVAWRVDGHPSALAGILGGS